jgi:predicted DNA-binding transcriptional regulator AlpA
MGKIEQSVTPSARLLRIRQVLGLYPISRSRWWQGVRTGEFPRPIRLTARTSAWREQDVLDLIARRIAEP